MTARDGRDPRELAAMGLDTHLEDKLLRRKYVSTMFDILAPGYDAFTQLFSFGMDRGWKALLVREGSRRAARAPCIVDLACGTGDLGIDLAERTGATLVLGLDLSPQMLAAARVRLRNNGTTLLLVACDMLELCLRENRVDVVSIGYGLRNTADLGQGLIEIARVLKPGGILLNLDFYKPAGRVWRELFLWYMWNAGRLAGWLWHREPIVYGYLAPSIRRYVTMPQFEDELARAGFTVEWRASRLGGGIGLHVARLVTKPPETRPG
ncbi:MAG: class I SAM-dependent methyltransferase [Acidobacteriia bacterium]|nr:class I SAM-dependent methyltransferase [Terriglobia bacterium]